MKRTLILLVVGLLFATSGWAQKRAVRKTPSTPILIKVTGDKALKINATTVKFPANGFYGHDVKILFNNLKYYLTQPAAEGKTGAELYQYLKGKPLLGNLTVDDSFVFIVYKDYLVEGVNRSDTNLVYRVNLFRLPATNEFPTPDTVRANDGCYGTMSPGQGENVLAASKNDLVSLLDVKPDEFWPTRLLPLETVVPRSRRGGYKGYRVGEQCYEFYVPSPQTHYSLTFAREQPFQIVEVKKESVFSLDTYRTETVKGQGLAAWLFDAEPKRFLGDYPRPMFVVKLVPPYLQTNVQTRQDPIENKLNRAVQNNIFVDLESIWFADYKTGKIFKKYNGERAPATK